MNENDETNKGYVGIWGWNTIPVLSLAVIVGWTLYTVATQHFPAFFNGLMWAFWDKGSEAYNFQLGVCIAIELACNLTLATFAVYALMLLAKRSASYPKLAARVLVAAAFIAGLDWFIVRHFGIESTAREEQEVFGGAIFAIVWMCYFATSQRIKNTFVNAPAKWRKGWLAAAMVLIVSALVCRTGMRGNNPFANIEASEAEAPAPEAPKTYICFLEAQADEDDDEEVDDDMAADLETQLKEVFGKRGIDDISVGATDSGDIVLAYANGVMIPDEIMQEIIDAAELSVGLEVMGQREFIPETK